MVAPTTFFSPWRLVKPFVGGRSKPLPYTSTLHSALCTLSVSNKRLEQELCVDSLEEIVRMVYIIARIVDEVLVIKKGDAHRGHIDN